MTTRLIKYFPKFVENNFQIKRSTFRYAMHANRSKEILSDQWSETKKDDNINKYLSEKFYLNNKIMYRIFVYCPGQFSRFYSRNLISLIVEDWTGQ